MMRMEWIFLCSLFLSLSYCKPPESYFLKQIQGEIDLGYNEKFEKFRTKGNVISKEVSLLIPNLPPQDEIILQEDLSRGFVATMDGWIWKINLKENTSERFVQTKMLPAGMVEHPKNKDILYFCMSREKVDDLAGEEGPGIYELRISSRTIHKIATRVPLLAGEELVRDGNIGFVAEDAHSISFANMNKLNSRYVEKADDLAISSDGERIYFTEPYDHPGAILGVSSQSRNEVLTLGKNAHLWKYDLKNRSASLVADKYSYLDGILLENDKNGREQSILVNELSKSRILRLYLGGEKKGKDEIVIDGLPGFPDGMDRDAQGRIWIALVSDRSALVTWLHKHPMLKKMLLYVPDRLWPLPRKTGIIALSADGAEVLYSAMEEGDQLSNIIVVVPGKKKLFLAIYQNGYSGLRVMNYPSNLKNPN